MTKKDIDSVHCERRSVAGSGRERRSAASSPRARLSRLRRAFQPGESVRIEKMGVMRKKIADHMVMSIHTSPHVYSAYEVDFGRVDRLRLKKKAEYEAAGTKLTFTGFIAKATVDTIRAVSVLERIDRRREHRLQARHQSRDRGRARNGSDRAGDQERGRKNLLGLSRAIQDLAYRARNKQLKPEEVQGGTFTITNPGIFGAVFGLPIISQPQVAILGVGSVDKRVVVVDDMIAIRPMCYPDARLRSPADRRRRRGPLPAGAEGSAAEFRRIVGVKTGMAAPSTSLGPGLSIARSFDVRRLGRVGYGEGLELQARLVDERRSGAIGDSLLLLEHPPVITLGVKTRGGRANIVATPEALAAEGVEVFETGRGGDITYHGPGQLVGYPILDLKPDRCDVHRYVRDIEEALIVALREFGIEGRRVEGRTGVWVGPAGREEKIAAIGVRISRWITSHGFALNVVDRPQTFPPDRPVRNRRPRRDIDRKISRPLCSDG